MKFLAVANKIINLDELSVIKLLTLIKRLVWCLSDEIFITILKFVDFIFRYFQITSL